jgi:hypothetical protein
MTAISNTKKNGLQVGMPASGCTGHDYINFISQNPTVGVEKLQAGPMGSPLSLSEPEHRIVVRK